MTKTVLDEMSERAEEILMQIKTDGQEVIERITDLNLEGY